MLDPRNRLGDLVFGNFAGSTLQKSVIDVPLALGMHLSLIGAADKTWRRILEQKVIYRSDSVTLTRVIQLTCLTRFRSGDEGAEIMNHHSSDPRFPRLCNISSALPLGIACSIAPTPGSTLRARRLS